MGDDILYKDKAKAKIQLMDFEEIKILWQKTCEKIPSPYISQDIYDLIVFRKKIIYKIKNGGEFYIFSPI